MKIISTFLQNVGWYTKILGLCLLFTAGIVIVGMLGGKALILQNDSMQIAIKESSVKVNAAQDVRLSLLSMDNAIKSLIAADDKKSIKMGAIGSIRAGAGLEDSMNVLKEALPDNHLVDLLKSSLLNIRPAQMKIIGKARNNDDDAALTIYQSMQPAFDEVTSNSIALVEQSRNELNNLLVTQEADTKKTINHIIEVTIFVVVIAMLCGFYMASLLSRPLSRVNAVMAAVAEGNLTQKLKPAGNDEVGRIVAKLNQTIEQLHRMMTKISKSAANVSNESQQVAALVDGVNRVAVFSQQTTSAIKESAEQTLAQTDVLAQKLTDAGETAIKSRDAAITSSNGVKKVVEDYREFQNNMVATMNVSQELAEEAVRINTITQTISDISSQTNLLALNAAIEAARAGEHGRGFAVVADEVRGLAYRTDQAVEEIATLVSSITEKVNLSVSSLEVMLSDGENNITQLSKMADATRDGSQQITVMSDTMHEVVGALHQQQSSIENISTSVSALTEVSEQTRDQAASLSSLSQNLDGAAGDLDSVVVQFKL